jgi:hypothetical protein
LLFRHVLAADVSGNNRLELDGNINDDGASATDWASICQAVAGVTTGNGYIDESSLPAGINPSVCKGDSYLLSATSFGVDDTYFASNKDIEDISGTLTGSAWGCVQINNPTPKDELFNGYAAQGTLPGSGDVALFMGFERGQNNGTRSRSLVPAHKVGCVGPATGQNTWSGGPHAEWHFDTTTRLLREDCDAAGTPGAGTAPCHGDLLVIANHATGGANTTVRGAAWAPDQACAHLDCSVAGNKKIASWPLLPLEGVFSPDCVATDTCVVYNAEAPTANRTGRIRRSARRRTTRFQSHDATAAASIRRGFPRLSHRPVYDGGKGQNKPILDAFQFVRVHQPERIFGRCRASQR